MVLRQAAKKTGAFMVLSAFMSIGIVTMLTEDLQTPVGRAVTTDLSGGNWIVFALGAFIGSLMIGTYFYLAHIEKNREFL